MSARDKTECRVSPWFMLSLGVVFAAGLAVLAFSLYGVQVVESAEFQGAQVFGVLPQPCGAYGHVDRVAAGKGLAGVAVQIDAVVAQRNDLHINRLLSCSSVLYPWNAR